ncbi:MAG: response regulator [Planctomycetota bacterium]
MDPDTKDANAPALDLIVAEDDLGISAVLCRVLRGRGHGVRAFGNGREALEAARDQAPDAVLTDYQMPVMDGAELALAFAGDPELNRVPIVMITARGHRVPDEVTASARLVRVIPKPFGSRDIERVLDELCPLVQGDAA